MTVSEKVLHSYFLILRLTLLRNHILFETSQQVLTSWQSPFPLADIPVYIIQTILRVHHLK